MTEQVAKHRGFQNGRALRRRLLFLLIWLQPALLYAQSAGPEFPRTGNAHMSRDDQRTLGLLAAAQVFQQMPTLPDNSPETQYIRKLGQKLVATIPPQYSWPFEFHVVAQTEVNAFALPGGPMFINIGTITAAANEAELAGVIAHEISHVYMQHSAKQVSKTQTTDLFAGIAEAALGSTVEGTVGELGQMGIQMRAQGLMLKYSRGNESQADAVGAVILYKAGYNPQAMADFFKTLESQVGQAPPQWLSDHPNTANREHAIEKEIRSWPPENYASTSPTFQKVRQHATRVRAYTTDEIAQGAKSGHWGARSKKYLATIRPTGANTSSTALSIAPDVSPSAAGLLESVLPSQRVRAANLGFMKIEYPDNWHVIMPTQRGQSLTIAPQAGITDTSVGYGVVLNSVAAHGERLRIDDVTHRLVQDMEQNDALQPVSDPQPIILDGMQGRAVTMQSTSPFPVDGHSQKERDWLITVPQSDGSAIFMIFVAPERHFDRLRPAFEAMLNSAQF